MSRGFVASFASFAGRDVYEPCHVKTYSKNCFVGLCERLGDVDVRDRDPR